MLDEKSLTMLSRARLATKRSLKMIIPTPEFDPLFAEDGVPFRTKMLGYIEREFSDILGDRQRLLNSNSGLDWLAQQISRELSPARSHEAA